MAKTGRKNHTHKYQRLSDRLWHCAEPDCSHYMPKNVAESIIGKNSICWDCGNEFILATENMKEDRPRCETCINPNLSKINEYLEDDESAIPSSMKQRIS